MPIYEYRCRKCGSQFELLTDFRRRHDPADCPVCGANDAQRQMSVCAKGATRTGSSCSISSGPG
ncbi:MAG: zinc ribbon domain-containing protein [Armatimonadetes bacterium]|mgnify:CR=1 FL=1|jgi:putative FmdB family regulatory protein|nr:zinc ribbon domain-containing protein [Armatimonadota bacterium]